jgi:ribonuclease HI
MINSLRTLESLIVNIHKEPTLPLYSYPFDTQIFKPNVLLTFGVSHGPYAKAKFQNILRTRWSEWSVVYTDGSKLDTGETGASFYARDGVVSVICKIRLPSASSIFTAESSAILEALKYVNSRNPGRFLILSDSLSVLTKLDSPAYHDPDDLVNLKIRDRLKNLKRDGYDITLSWIPAHCGILGNEKADALAKEAATSGLCLSTEITAADAKNFLQNKMLSDWRMIWSESCKLKGKFYARIQPDIPNKPWFQKIKMNKFGVSTLSRMRLGHCCCGSHLYRIGVVRSPYCECGATEDLNHLFFECPINDRYPLLRELLRCRVELPTDISTILSTNNAALYKILLAFINSNTMKI